MEEQLQTDEQIMEEAHPEMSADEAMAALAISTRLSEQMMAQQAPQGEDMPVEGEISPETAPEGTETPPAEELALDEIEEPTEPETPQEDPMVEMDGKMEDMKSELKDTIKTEIKSVMDGFKKMIADELKD